METALVLFAILVGGGLLRLGLQHYNDWRIERNELPDEERAKLFWNDRNYERLQLALNFFWYGLAGILLIAVVLVYAARWLGW